MTATDNYLSFSIPRVWGPHVLETDAMMTWHSLTHVDGVRDWVFLLFCGAHDDQWRRKLASRNMPTMPVLLCCSFNFEYLYVWAVSYQNYEVIKMWFLIFIFLALANLDFLSTQVSFLLLLKSLEIELPQLLIIIITLKIRLVVKFLKIIGKVIY